jgi:alpha-tubulin suppressor-like RCC1 family protein/Leucine-rich repeat (LRR) protein
MRKTLLLILIFSFIQIKAQCWKTAAAGYSHTVAVRNDGTLWTWGNNDEGQLGNSTPAAINIPTKMGTANNWKTAAAGWGHTVALKTDGTLWAWGYGRLGQLGNGNYNTNFNLPQQIGTENDWQTIAAGHGHTVALKNDGTLWAWGNNFSGQLGNGTSFDRNTPTKIGSDSNWLAIAAGGLYTIALKKDGTLWAWGKNTYGTLGDGTTTNNRVPKQIGTDTDWKTIAAGSDHTIAIKNDGSLWIWGKNTNGALGDNTTIDKIVPTKIGTDTDWKSAEGGVDYTVAIKTDGTLWAWGYNADGVLGNGSKINSLIPVQIGTEKNWQMVNGGSVHTVAVKTDESLWSWGNNSSGQLGDGTSIEKNIPTLLNCAGSLIVTVSQTNVRCAGSNEGSASITSVSGGTAPYTYLWSNGKTTSSITELAAGDYSCTITDATSLSITKNITITQPPALFSIVTVVNTNCNNNNGSIEIIANGGTLPYQYAVWPDIIYQDSNIFTGLPSGNYQIMVKDNNGCYVTTFVIIEKESTPVPTVSAQTLSASATVSNLKAAGSNLKWFTTLTGGSALAASASLQTGKYYVSQTINGCESVRAAVDITILPASYGEIPTNGLVAYYTFNGNANDTSGNGFNGTAVSTNLASDRFGNSNSAYSFDGAGSYIDAAIANIPQGNAARTVSGWFKTNTPNLGENGDVCIFNYGALSRLQRFGLTVYSKGYLETSTGPNAIGDDFYVNNFNYLSNDWYFFTLTYNGTKVSLYVNGVFVSEKNAALNTTNNLFRIGKRIPGDTTNEYFKGQIDDIGIWNRVLTPEEIAAMYTPGEQPAYTLIPDPSFEQKLINLGIDSGVVDGKVRTSDIASVESLNVSSSSISDLTGIQDFVSLTNLNCGQNNLKALNVSNNTALTVLDCNNNQIAYLDVSNNLALTDLACYSNKLTSLDVKKNTALTKLDSGSNQYTSLDVSHNTALTFLGCNTSQLTTIDVSNNTALKLLDCRENKITSLDVSKITTLTELYCQSNELKDLDISKNKVLEFLNCSKNQLTTLDISTNTALVGLFPNYNQLINLNLKNGNNDKLIYLNFKNNPNLTCIQVDDAAFANANWTDKKDAGAAFNVKCDNYTLIPDVNFENRLIALGYDSGSADGKVLTANISNITSLNVSSKSISNLSGIQDFTSLTTLNCAKNNLTSLNLKNNKNLKTLYCEQNQLTTLDLSNNVSLITVECSYNKLQNVNISKNLVLKNLYCINNQLTNIDVTNNTALEQFYCFGNQLTSLNVSKNLNLLGLECGLNKLTTLDVSNNTLMYYLECYSNQLTSLNVTKNNALFHLNFFNNQLTSIDLSNNPLLKELYCLNNQLTSLDLSKNNALTNLDCKNNKLTALNLKNGNNTLLATIDLNFTQNPDLTCIQVDNAAYSNTNWPAAKDAAASFSENCGSISIPDSNFEQKLVDLGIDTDGLNGKITIADASAVTILNLSNSNIKDLTGIEYFTSLTYLDVSSNQLTTLDVRKNILLETLNASSNQLTTLDLSKNTKLRIVYVVNNPLVSLNLRNGNNTNFILPPNIGKKSVSGLYTSFLGLKTLGCIQVDDENYSNANWSNIKESTTSYSNTCKTLGVPESALKNVVIHPNPTKGELHIQNVNLEKANVYNVLGQLVKSFTLNSNNTDNTINLSGLPKGVYYVYLINQDAASAKKVIVE